MQPGFGAEMPAPPTAEKSGFLSTTRGKVIVIVGAVFGLGLIAALGVGAFLLFFVNEAGDALQQAIDDASVTTTSTPAGEESDGMPVEPEPVALSEVFTFRDIFVPLIVIVEEEEDLEEQEYPDIDPDTLYLHEIVEREDGLYAVLIWQNQPTEVPLLGEILGSPWRVLEINTDSVTMLYGDEQITLIVGQAISTGPATPDVPVSK